MMRRYICAQCGVLLDMFSGLSVCLECQQKEEGEYLERLEGVI